ncbi:hypothetical protein [Endozoicomonas atrinae]|uniref:hypothetical protein n=1 Tax=Endozoicomonas atrinae TaxID=1333660 RepID=UPI000825B860|nr:hypothetical protein [Endozoicomonas atrinae]
MEQQAQFDTEITTLDQAELVIRRKGIVLNEMVEGENLLQICGLTITNPKQQLDRQIAKHGFIDGKDFQTSMFKSGGRTKTVYNFSVNAANHVLLATMTPEGKQARQDAINDRQQNPEPVIDKLPTPSPHQLLELHMDASLKAITFAREFGLDGNQAMLAADRMVKKRLDFSPLEEMGHPALIAPVKAPLYTVTELGKLSDPVFSAVNMNLHLHDHGLQVRVGDQWTPTEKGKPFCEMLDVGKHHGDGTPVKQLKWYASVLPTLTKPWRRYITPKPAEKTPAPEPKPTPPTVAEDQPDTGKPVITRQHKSRRSSDRMRGRYGLPDHFSIYELADELELQKGYIEDVLKKHRIIKWKPMKHSGKFVLTDTGWHYGKMYDPSTKQFREKGKRVMTTQCQPVFGYDILKFFM